MGSWFSNPGTGSMEVGAAGGGVGKYLKARNSQTKSTTAPDTAGETISTISVPKKRKLSIHGQELKDFSAW